MKKFTFSENLVVNFKKIKRTFLFEIYLLFTDLITR